MSKHTKGKIKLKHGTQGPFGREPWIAVDRDDDRIANVYGEDRERTAACIVACEGIEDPSVVPEMLRGLKDARTRLGLLKQPTNDLDALIARAEGRK